MVLENVKNSVLLLVTALNMHIYADKSPTESRVSKWTQIISEED